MLQSLESGALKSNASKFREGASPWSSESPGALLSSRSQSSSSVPHRGSSFGSDLGAALSPLGATKDAEIKEEVLELLQTRPVLSVEAGKLFGDRGPQLPKAPSEPTMLRRLPQTQEALRSTPGQRPERKAETNEEARHRLASSQIDDNLSPEEVETIAKEAISQLKRNLEFDADRIGEDIWD